MALGSSSGPDDILSHDRSTDQSDQGWKHWPIRSGLPLAKSEEQQLATQASDFNTDLGCSWTWTLTWLSVAASP